MIRTLIWFLYFWLYQLAIFPSLLRAEKLAASGNLQEADGIAADRAKNWAAALLKLAGCQVTLKGREHLEGCPGAVLFVSNHQSNFDIPILLATLDRPAGFVAKESLAKLPLVSRWMRLIHCVFIRRDNPREAAAAISEGIRLLKQGYSQVVFPEGTRSADGALQEFKAGALKLAGKSGVPVIPVAIDGSLGIMRKGSFLIHPAQVIVTACPPIRPEQWDPSDTVALAAQIQHEIEVQMKNR